MKEKHLIGFLFAAFFLIFFIPRCKSQERNNVNFGFKYISIGAGLNVGYESGNIAIDVGMTHPLKSAVNPEVYYLKCGYVYQLSEENSFNIGIYGGIALTNKMIVMDDKVKSESKSLFFPSIEVGNDIEAGRIYIESGYVGKAYFGAGVKFYF
jgi:hypothetical protein